MRRLAPEHVLVDSAVSPPLIATNATSLTGKKLFSRTQVRRRFSSMSPRTVLAQLINDEPAATSFTSHTSNPLTLACSNVLLCSLSPGPSSGRLIWSCPLACAGGVTVGRVITTTRNDDEERTVSYTHLTLPTIYSV